MKEYAALIRVLACILAASVLFVGGCHHGKTSAELKAYEDGDKARSALADLLDKERGRSAGLNDEIRTLLNRPNARDTIRETIRLHPSNCERPAAVTDGLRSEIAAANQAIAASGGNDAVPADTADGIN